MTMSDDASGDQRVRKVVTILAVIGAVAIAAMLVIAVIGLSVSGDVVYASIVVTHYPVTFGLPMAAIAALVLVFLLEYARGPVEFEVPGFKFKGAAGPLVMWVIVYLAIASSIAFLWDSTMSSHVVDSMSKARLETAVLEEKYKRCILQAEREGHDLLTIPKLCASRISGVD
jgi:hypothetical protein